MAESSTLVSKARDLLATSSHGRFDILLNQLARPQESIEFQSSLALFNFCASNFPNCLTQMLLKVYRSSSNDFTRLQSIHLLSSTLDEFRIRKTQLSLVALKDIKPLLISCLEMQETEEIDMKILRKIVSFVAYDVVSLDNDGWDELSDCILSFAETQPLKAFHVFVELPRVYQRFIDRFLQRIIEEAEKVLLVNHDDVEVWSLALETLVKMGIQILDSETRLNLVKTLLSKLVKSVNELVKMGMEQLVVQGLESLEKFLSRDKDLYGYSKNQCLFVSTFMYGIRELRTTIKEAAKKINRLVLDINNPQKNQDPDHVRFERLNTLSLLGIVRIFASDNEEERYKDMAIRRVNLLLSEQNPKKAEIDVSVMRELQALLVSCLSKQGISESMFKILGEVVHHVAFEMMFVQKEPWFGLRDYIASQSKTEFQRAVYIFRCLTMPLDGEEFVIPVMDSLLPEIRARLNPPPSEVLVDNSGWVLAFAGAFSAIIQLIKIKSRAESVKEVAYKMIDSVRELVERGMEVGLVRRAFRDVEIIVKKHLEWFSTSEYKFAKGMLWKLYEIKGMKMESKVVLWRINFVVERGVAEQLKELPKSIELDWISQYED